ncbi:MAG: 3-methyl-2-oxobutanoate hydroxymethyltransferase [Candidatus Aceula meridiana]|nr:3-methyl-2-oxobutanoate hydroxymethyltransferase [Candidatus Aceula meridiana]
MVRITPQDICHKKKNQEKVVALTAYDYSMARLIDQAGVHIVLVGDSVANVVLGLDSTKEVGMAEMLHHAKAVSRGVQNALVVGDMPFESYQVDVSLAVDNAKKFIEEAGCGAVKLEWFDQCLEVTQAVVKSGIAVMGHIGLTPQTAEALGGFKVQGKDAESAKKLMDQAKALEKAGCFSLVLECIPERIAQYITENISIPTIGIGAGVHCDGQVLVVHDILGLFDRFRPKFVKQYVDLSAVIKKAVHDYKIDVIAERFPGKEHGFAINEQEFELLKEGEK